MGFSDFNDVKVAIMNLLQLSKESQKEYATGERGGW